MGIGMIRVKAEKNLTQFFPPALILLTGSCVYFSNVLTDGRGYVCYLHGPITTQSTMGNDPGIECFFSLSALPFIPLRYAMGKEFKNFPALHAYAINTAGSLTGLLIFDLLSHFSTPPLVWSRGNPFPFFGGEATKLYRLHSLSRTGTLFDSKPLPKRP